MQRQLAILICASFVSASHINAQSTTPSQVTDSTALPSEGFSTIRPYYAVPVGAKTITIDNQQYTSQPQPALQYVSPNLQYVQVPNPSEVKYQHAPANYEFRGSVSTTQNPAFQAFNSVISTPPTYVSVTSHPPSANYVVRNQEPIAAQVNIQSRPIQYEQRLAAIHRPVVKTHSVEVEGPIATKTVEFYSTSVVNPTNAPPTAAPTTHTIGHVQTVGQVQNHVQVQNVDQGQSQNYPFINYAQSYAANPVLVKSEVARPPALVESRTAAVEVPRVYVTPTVASRTVQNVVSTPVVNIQRPAVKYVNPAVVQTVVQPGKKVTIEQYGAVTTHPPPAAYAKPTYDVKTVQVAPVPVQQVPVHQVRYIQNPAAVKTATANYDAAPVLLRYSPEPQRIAVPVQYRQEEVRSQLVPQQVKVLTAPAHLATVVKSPQLIPVPVEYPKPQVVQYNPATPIVHANSFVEKVYTPVQSQEVRRVFSTPEPVYAKAVAYSPAESVSRVSFNGLGVSYGW